MTIESLSMTFTALGRRQTAKITSDFLFFSRNLEINHTKMEKCLLLFTANTNVLIPLYRVLKTDGKSFMLAVCRKRHAYLSNMIFKR